MRAKAACARVRGFVSRTIACGLIVVLIIVVRGNAWAQMRGPFGADVNPGRSRSADMPTASLSGRVVANGKPLPGVTVQLQNPASGVPVASAATGDAGQFEISGLQPGEYILVAEYQTQTVHDHISIRPLEPEIEINFPAETSASSSVSVGELQVPEKARRRLQQAQQALARKDVAEP